MKIWNRLEGKLRRATELGAKLAGEGHPLAAAKWTVLSAAGVEKRLPISVGKVPVTIRTNSSDLDVVMVSLRGELDDVFEAVPTLENDFIIDAGGYIGTAAISFARAYPNATIVTLEPSKDNFALLCQNVKGYPNIRPVNAALANAPGTLTLHNRGTGQSGFTIVAQPDDRPDSVVLHVVDCVTVPDLMAQFGKRGVDILKLDIEGGEFALLSEKPDWISKVGALCIELHERIVSGCTAAFESAAEGRDNKQLAGEKFLSLRKGASPASR